MYVVISSVLLATKVSYSIVYYIVYSIVSFLGDAENLKQHYHSKRFAIKKMIAQKIRVNLWIESSAFFDEKSKTIYNFALKVFDGSGAIDKNR